MTARIHITAADCIACAVLALGLGSVALIAAAWVLVVG